MHAMAREMPILACGSTAQMTKQSNILFHEGHLAVRQARKRAATSPFGDRQPSAGRHPSDIYLDYARG